MLSEGRSVNVEALRTPLRFFRDFADKCHHGKEENSLFPRLEASGIPREGGPIGVMLVEHELGRGYIKAMNEALNNLESEEARVAFVDNALSYIALLRDHIFKEDNVLFDMARAVLSEEDDRRLLEEFKEIELEKLGPGVHEELARSLDVVEKLLILGVSFGLQLVYSNVEYSP